MKRGREVEAEGWSGDREQCGRAWSLSCRGLRKIPSSVTQRNKDSVGMFSMRLKDMQPFSEGGKY